MLVCYRRPSAGLRMHNRCCASAYQLLCKRTTAVVRPTELTSPITYTIFSDNFICLFRQLLPYSAISFPYSVNSFNCILHWHHTLACISIPSSFCSSTRLASELLGSKAPNTTLSAKLMMQESLGTLVAQSKLFRMSRLVVLLEQRNAVLGRSSNSRFPIWDSISGI